MADVTLYQIRYRVKAAPGKPVNPWILYGVPEPDLQEDIIGLSPGTTYELQVVATNAQGSVVSQTTTFTTSLTAPSAPGAPVPSSITTTTLVLNWSASTTGTGISYQVMMRVSGIGSYVAVGPLQGITSLSVSGLTQNTAYDFRVVATNTVGTATSATTTVTTASVGIAPSAPTALHVIGVPTTTAINIGWTGSTGTAPITYQLRYRVSGAVSFLPFGGPISGGSVNVTSLTAGTTYDFVVDAINSVNTTTSTTFNASTAVATAAPSVPSIPVASAIFTTSMTVTWGTSTGTPTPTYQLQSRIGASGTFANIGAPIAGNSLIVTGLASSTIYNFQVVAANTAGTATSAIMSATTATALVAPSQPRTLSSSAVSSSSVTLTWVAPATGTLPFTYRVQSAPSGSGNWVNVAGPLSALTFVVPSLLPSTQYDFRVFATNEVGEGPTSATYTTTTAAAVTPTAPGAVTGLTVGAITSTTIVLSWSAPTTGTTPFTYHVKYGNTVIAPESVHGASLTSATGALTDGAGRTWTLVASTAPAVGPFQIVCNGVLQTDTSAVTLLKYYKPSGATTMGIPAGSIIQENTSSNWYYNSGMSGNVATWTQVAGDPFATSLAPPQAAAVGYNTRVFGPNVTLNQNWFMFRFFGTTGTTATQNSDGTIHLPGGVGNNYNAHLCTAAPGGPAGWTGSAWAAGVYFELTASFTGQVVGWPGNGSGWPIPLWANDVVEMAVGHPANPDYWWPEPDMAEFIFNNGTQYASGTHNWYSRNSTSPTGDVNQSVGNVVNLPPGTDLAQPHKYGFLIVPSTPTAQGYTKSYFDGVYMGATYTWNQYGGEALPAGNMYGAPGGPPGSIFDNPTRLYALIAGTSSENPMTIYSAEVWKAP